MNPQKSLDCQHQNDCWLPVRLLCGQKARPHLQRQHWELLAALRVKRPVVLQEPSRQIHTPSLGLGAGSAVFEHRSCGHRGLPSEHKAQGTRQTKQTQTNRAQTKKPTTNNKGTRSTTTKHTTTISANKKSGRQLSSQGCQPQGPYFPEGTSHPSQRHEWLGTNTSGC